jgi:hypothetical protein
MLSFLLPTTLSYAWDFAATGFFTEIDAIESKAAHIGARAAGKFVAILEAGGAGIAGEFLEPFEVA